VEELKIVSLLQYTQEVPWDSC